MRPLRTIQQLRQQWDGQTFLHDSKHHKPECNHLRKIWHSITYLLRKVNRVRNPTIKRINRKSKLAATMKRWTCHRWSKRCAMQWASTWQQWVNSTRHRTWCPFVLRCARHPWDMKCPSWVRRLKAKWCRAEGKSSSTFQSWRWSNHHKCKWSGCCFGCVAGPIRIKQHWFDLE